MNTSVEFLIAVKTRLNIPTDAQLARKLELTSSAITSLMKKKTFMGNETAYKVAMLLGISPEYTMSCANAERESNEKLKFVWQRLAGRINDEWKLAA